MLRSSKILFVGLIVAVGLGATAWRIQQQLKSNSLTELEQSLQTILETTHQAIESWYKEQQTVASIWANIPELRLTAAGLNATSQTRTALLSSPHQKTLRGWLQPLSREQGYHGYFIIGRNGINLASSRDENVGVKNLLVRQPDFLKMIWSGHSMVSLPDKPEVSLPDKTNDLRVQMATMFVGAPIKDISGKVIAILTLRLDPSEEFTHIFTHGQIGRSGETYAFDSQGRLISESRFNEQLRAMGLLAPNEQSILNIEVRDPGGNSATIQQNLSSLKALPLTRMAVSALNGESSSNVFGYRDYRGVQVVGAWLWDSVFGFGIATEIDVAQAYHIIRTTQNVILALTLLIVFLLMGLALLYRTIESRKRAEKALRKARAELEQRVQTRTTELADVNEELIKEIVERQQAEGALSESEHNFRAIFEQAAVGVALIETKTGCFLKINKKYCDIVAYSNEEMLNTTFQNITHPADVDADLKHMQKLVAGEISEFSIQKRYYRKDGVVVWVNLTVSPMWVAGEEPDYHIAIIEDISRRKQAEELLLHERDRAQQYLDTVEAIVVALNAQGEITLVNRKGCEILGYTEAELTGKNWFSTCLPQPEGAGVVFEVFLSIMKGNLENIEYYENTIVTHSGEQRLIAWHNSYIRGSQGQINGILSSGEDITEIKLAKEKAEQHQAELAHMARLNTMGEMATGIAHELNQPLTAVANYASVCQQIIHSVDKPPSTFSEALEGIQSQTMRAAEIIRRLRDFVRKKGPEMSYVNLNELVNDVVGFVLTDAHKLSVDLKLQLDDQLPLVYADSIQIEQVLLNLARNSMEAMDSADSKTRELIIRTFVNNEKIVQANVADTGPGMDADILNHIFDPFFSTKEGAGMGMGLSISRSIVEAHGGRLTADSSASQGATFCFTLPVSRTSHSAE